jgi:hypothetical protein
MLQEIVMTSSNDRPVPRSSAALQRTTGRDRAEWFAVLDAWGAGGRPYREIADWLKTEHQLSNWWAQKLIVEYEESRRLRDPGVRRDGTFEVGASKTIEADRDRVVEAFIDPTVRKRWLPGQSIDDIEHVAGGIRFGWTDGTSRVRATVATTTGGKAQVDVQHDRLTDAALATNTKEFWRDRLTALKALLERG